MLPTRLKSTLSLLQKIEKYTTGTDPSAHKVCAEHDANIN